MPTIGAKVTSNFLWRFLERSGAQGVSFIVSIVLARLLAPEVYGTVALVTVFTSIMQVFVDSGMGNALIQKKDADDIDFSTVFFFNIIVCTFLYLLMFIAAPLISVFYEKPELTSVIRVMSLTLVISGVRNVQQAYVSRNMLFKRFFYATLGGTLVSAIIGIFMAYQGYGVWALVGQQLTNTAVGTIILWITVKWRPKRLFSFVRLKSLFSYGWKLLASSLLETVYRDIRQLIIGKMYTADDLAFYNQGDKFPKLIISNINTSIDSVLLPTMSKEQDNRERVKAMTRRAIKTSTYIMAPLMMGLAAVSEPVVKLILTDKWLPCVPYLCIFCITCMFYPIHTANLNAIKATGRSDLFLKLEIIKKIMSVSVLLVTMWFGPLVMAASGLVTTVLSQVINASPNKKLLDYSILEQWKDIAPGIILAVIMGACVWDIGYFLPLPNVATLAIQVFTGGAIYIGGSVLFKMEAFYYVLNTAKGFIKHRKAKAA